MRFKDRHDAGKQLAQLLMPYSSPNNILIALPRGGVVVAFEIALMLHLPLDIVCPRKIGAPFNPEFAIGAITETGEAILSTEIIEELGIPSAYVQAAMEKEKKEAEWRLNNYRKKRPPRNVEGKIAILIDDGLATGATMRAAISTLKKERASKLIVAVPVAPRETAFKIKNTVDEFLCLTTPEIFFAVGQFYERFDQIKDDEVIDLLEKSYIISS
jgi:putative phosphoribosyl transferase